MARKRLKQWIRDHTTQKAFARDLHVSEGYVSQILHGDRVPSLPILAEIEDLTGIGIRSWLPSFLTGAVPTLTNIGPEMGKVLEFPSENAELANQQNQGGVSLHNRHCTNPTDLASGQHRPKLSESERFWSKVLRGGEDDCWVWRGSCARGYGQFSRGSKPKCPAHRYSWELVHGPIPDGLVVCHKCDNPPCVNPTHLFLGTQGDNLADCRAKGRMPDTRVRKLTPADVEAIRAAAAAGGRGVQNRLAEQYGVTKVCISLIVNGHRKVSRRRTPAAVSA